MADPRYPEILDGPYSAAAAITPADGADITPPTAALPAAARALVIGVAGNVAVDLPNGGTNVVIALPAGVHPIAVTRVRATGTTATGIVALW